MRKNVITFSLCALFIFTIVFSFLFIATKSEHTHVGDTCHICVEMNQYKTLLNSIFSAGTLYIGIYTMLFQTSWISRFKNNVLSFSTPVSLKVKLLN